MWSVAELHGAVASPLRLQPLNAPTPNTETTGIIYVVNRRLVHSTALPDVAFRAANRQPVLNGTSVRQASPHRPALSFLASTGANVCRAVAGRKIDSAPLRRDVHIRRVIRQQQHGARFQTVGVFHPCLIHPIDLHPARCSAKMFLRNF